MSGPCVQEPLVARAAVEQNWTDALRRHVTDCRDCEAAAMTAPFMTRLARLEVLQRALPDPAVLWLKAQFLRGAAVADRAQRPLDIAQMISYVVIAAGWAGLLTRKWTELRNGLLSVTPSHLLGDLASAQSSLSATLAATVVVLVSITVLLGLHAILAEE